MPYSTNAASQISPEYIQAASLLEALFSEAPDDEFLEMRFLPGGGSRYHRLDDVRANWEATLPVNRDGKLHIYYGINPRVRRRGRQRDVEVCIACQADEIRHPFPDGFPAFNARIQTSPAKYQLLWFLRPTGDVQRVYRVNQAIQRLLGSDATPDLGRVFRLPGFVNIKYPERPRSRLLYLASEPRYTLDELETAVSRLAPTATGTPVQVANGASDFNPHWGQPLPQDMRQALIHALSQCGLKPVPGGRFSGSCVFAHTGGDCDCPNAFYASPVSGTWNCFCTDHPGIGEGLCASGGPDLLLPQLKLEGSPQGTSLWKRAKVGRRGRALLPSLEVGP